MLIKHNSSTTKSWLSGAAAPHVHARKAAPDSCAWCRQNETAIMSKLANETALATVASRGMGGAAALVLAAAGARDRAFTATAWPELTQADGAGLSRAPGPCPWMSITATNAGRATVADSSSIGGATRIDPRTAALAPISTAVFMTSK
jgi:hypothetical protein